MGWRITHSRFVSALAPFVALIAGSTDAQAWFPSWQEPPAFFDRPYPSQHLAIIRSVDPDSNCGNLWQRSGGTIWVEACTIAPQDDPGALRIRFAFIASHNGWAGRWHADPKLCVIVLPDSGLFGIDDDTSRALLRFEEAHCWGWRERPPPR